MIDQNIPVSEQAYDKWRVVIVDDEIDNRMVAKSVLEFYGATVYTAPGASDGLRLLHEQDVNLVLLDLSMPGMSGWELLALMREQDEFKDLPVIALTAHAMRGDKERVLAAGFTAYIPKPYDATAFAQQIRDVLRAATAVIEKSRKSG